MGLFVEVSLWCVDYLDEHRIKEMVLHQLNISTKYICRFLIKVLSMIFYVAEYEL